MKKNLFYNWMETQTLRIDPIGDLARYISQDNTFPRQAKLKTTIKKHLKETVGQNTPFVKIFVEAYNEYNERGQREYTELVILNTTNKMLERLRQKQKNCVRNK